MTVGQYIKELRISRGMSQEELGEMLGVKKAAVQKWECGAVKNLKHDVINGLGRIFNVSPSEFIVKSEKDLAESKFGELWDYKKREAAKESALKKLDEDSKNIKDGASRLTIHEKVKLQETVLRALFSRSVDGYGYRLSHPDFPEYVAMILGQKKCCLSYLDDETYDELKRLYGTKPGYIKSGFTYYDPQHLEDYKLDEEVAKIALFGENSEVTDEMWSKVKNYIDYLLGRTDTPRGTLGDDLSDTEKKLIAAYRNKPEMQSSVNKLLDVQETDASQLLEKIKVRIAAGELNPTDGKIAAFGGYTKPKSEEEAERLAEIESLLKSIRESQKDSD